MFNIKLMCYLLKADYDLNEKYINGNEKDTNRTDLLVPKPKAMRQIITCIYSTMPIVNDL